MVDIVLQTIALALDALSRVERLCDVTRNINIFTSCDHVI